MVREDFAGRVLPFDSTAAEAYGTSPPRADPWAGRSWRPATKSPPSPALPAQPSQRATAPISSTAGFRLSIRGLTARIVLTLRADGLLGALNGKVGAILEWTRNGEKRSDRHPCFRDVGPGGSGGGT